MIEQDYLLRLIAQFIQAMLHAMRIAGRRVDAEDDEEGALDGQTDEGRATADPLGAAALLETAFGECIDMDASTMLVLAPESFAGVLQISGVDAQLVPHLVRCLELEADFLDEGGMAARAELRRGQAEALARAYGLETAAETEF